MHAQAQRRCNFLSVFLIHINFFFFRFRCAKLTVRAHNLLFFYIIFLAESKFIRVSP